MKRIILDIGSMLLGMLLTAEEPYIEELHRQAEAGDAEAQLNLGLSYQFGTDVAQNFREAARWYRLAASQDDAQAQCNLGWCYDRGMGVEQDHSEAVKWFRLAANQGLAEAQSNLAMLYYKGEGVTQDHRQAARLLRQAADQGYPKAQLNLGVLYAVGKGVAQDIGEAYFWFWLAEANGVKDAKFGQDMMAKELTPQLREQIQARATKRIEELRKDEDYRRHCLRWVVSDLLRTD